MNIDGSRSSGILMHITSLDSEYGIGDLGPAAYRFADKVKESGANLWQLLPLGPTGYGNSPYSARSTFAGNELLISPELLYKDGYLEQEDLFHPDFPSNKVDFNSVIEYKLPLLKKAAKAFLKKNSRRKAYLDFLARESFWLEDYALFMVLYEKYNDARWYSIWDEKEGFRDPKTIERIKKEKKEELKVWYALQYLFDDQLNRLHIYTKSLGIKTIGDIPIFVGADSADAWAHLDLLKTDDKGHYSAVSGVPPDNFSATGQLWGNPVYDWKKHEESGFEWWLQRIKRLLHMTDILRIDHFRGLDAYYEIAASAKTAEHGKWKKSPGKKLFETIKKELGELPIIAEDLGLMTDSVKKLRDSNGFPGMKIAMFGFSRDKNGNYNPSDDFLPMNYTRDFVAYTGTHDNDTTRGWFDSLSEDDKHMVREYLACDDREAVWALIRAVMFSNADIAIIPMQDILELGNDARMNYPSTCNDKNWSWRMESGAFDDYRLSRFKHLVRLTGRDGKTASERECLD